MQTLGQLQKVHPASPTSVAWHSLQSLLDAISPSVATVDAAYFALEELHREARPPPPPPPLRPTDCGRLPSDPKAWRRLPQRKQVARPIPSLPPSPRTRQRRVEG